MTAIRTPWITLMRLTEYSLDKLGHELLSRSRKHHHPSLARDQVPAVSVEQEDWMASLKKEEKKIKKRNSSPRSPRRRSRFKAALQPDPGLRGTDRSGHGEPPQAAIQMQRVYLKMIMKCQAAGTMIVKSEVVFETCNYISTDDLHSDKLYEIGNY